MKQKINIVLSCVACCVILLLLLMVYYWKTDTKNTVGEVADNYEQLDLFIQHSFETEEIHIWKSEADCYYFFLPSYAADSRLFFGNLRERDSVIIDNAVYGKDDDIAGCFEYNVAYDIQLNVKGDLLPVQQVVFMCSANLPTIYIDTETGTAEYIHSDKEIKEAAEVTILNQNGSVEFSGAIDYIKTRGNSTFLEVEKKSYQIKFFNKKSIFGMEGAKKWILLANAKDDSLIRNALIFDFASQYTEVESIEGIFVDVYLNGDYAGNYYLCEKVEVSDSRLDITDLDEKNAVSNKEAELKEGEQYISEDGAIRAVVGVENPEDITGGYLLERIVEEEYAETRSGFISSQDILYRVVSPEHASIEQVEYIRNLINEVECTISQPDGVHPDTGKHFTEYIDMDSWATKYLIEEFFGNPDAPYASTYLYKDSDEVNPLIHFGPVWDYDRAIGGYAVNIYFLDDPRQVGYKGLYAAQLLQHENVTDLIKSKYKECFVPYLEIEARKDIETMQQEIEASAQMNRVRWPQTIGYYAEWEANGNYLMSFLEEKSAYLSDIWLEDEQYHTITFLDYYGNTYDVYKVKHGEYLTEVPDITAYVAIFNGWKSAATGKRLNARLPVLEDAVYQSSWIDADLVLLNGLAMAGVDIENIDVDSLEALLEAVKKMQEGTDE